MKKKLIIALAVVVAVEVASCLMKTYNDNRFKELEAFNAEMKKEIKLQELQLEWLRKGHLATVL